MWTYVGRTESGIELYAAPEVARGLPRATMVEEEEARRPGLLAVVNWEPPSETMPTPPAAGGLYYFELKQTRGGEWQPLYVGVSRNLARRIPVQWARFKAFAGARPLQVRLGTVKVTGGVGAVGPRDVVARRARFAAEHALIRTILRRGREGYRRRGDVPPDGPPGLLANRSSVRPFLALGRIAIKNSGNPPPVLGDDTTIVIDKDHWYEFESAP